MNLVSILACVVAGSVGATVVSGGLLLFPDGVRKRLLPALISYATGTLLGGAFLGLIPHALRQQPEAPVLTFVLIGILLFFALERLLIWRHCHREGCTVHPTAGSLILIGDAVHNFADGIIIVASFLGSSELGVATTVAVVAHEMPQEVGDFAILLGSGYSARRAFFLNVVSASAALIGGVGAYLLLRQSVVLLPYVMAMSAASFIYIAIADLIPGMHRDTRLGGMILQTFLIVAGAATIWLLH